MGAGAVAGARRRARRLPAHRDVQEQVPDPTAAKRAVGRGRSGVSRGSRESRVWLVEVTQTPGLAASSHGRLWL